MGNDETLAKDQGTLSQTASVQHSPRDEKEVMPERSGNSKITTRSMLLMTTVCSGGFLFGYDIGVISGCLIMPDFIQRFGEPTATGYTLPAETQARITALLGAGTFFGSLFQAPLSDFFGRQKSMIFWSILFVVGAVVQTATNTEVVQIQIGRLIAGLSVGALSGLCPLYLGETAPKALRGTIVSCYQLLIILGIAVSYGITWASSTAVNSSASWRIPVGLQMLWGLLLTIFVIFLPESPRWELQRGNIRKAKETMAAMRGIPLIETGEGPKGDWTMEQEFEEMEYFISKEREVFKDYNYITSYAKCFAREKQMWRRTVQGCLLQIFQQLNGQNFYYYYGPVFFQSAALPLGSFAVQFILGIVSLICTVPALYTIERVGRRNLLLFGNTVCFCCALIVALVGHYCLAPEGTPQNQITGSQKQAGNAFIAFAIIHLASYSSSIGPVPWVYLSESFDTITRAKSISLGSAANWLFNFFLSYFSPGLSDQYGTFILLIFAGIIFASFCFTFLVLPETRGLTIEQVDVMYETGAANRPWKTSKWVPPIGDNNRAVLGSGIKAERTTAVAQSDSEYP